MKLLLVALEMGMAGILFNMDKGSEVTQHTHDQTLLSQ